MKLIPLVITFLSLSNLLIGQFTNSQLIATDLASCQIDSVTVQSLVNSSVRKVAIDDSIDLVAPTDLVLLIFDRTNQAPVFTGPVFVEGETITFTRKGVDCDEIVVQSAAQSRVEAFEAMKNSEEEVAAEAIFEKIKANQRSIFVHRYLQFYIKNALKDTETSKKIIQLFADSDSPVKESLMVQPFLSRISLSFSEEVFHHSDFDLLSHPANTSASTVAPNYYLYDFWYTRCAPCLRDHPIIEEDILSLTIPEQVKVISICSRVSSVEDWENYLSKNKIPWDNYHVGETSTEISRKYGINFFPTYILTDKEGNIMEYTSSYSKVREVIKGLD